MRSTGVLILLLVLAIVPAVSSQSDFVEITYGEIITGQISAAAPREVYRFEALRCDFISLRLRATSGNLDPVLVVLDESGRPVFNQDDSGGTLNVTFEPLLLPRSGTYYVVVSRFGHALGTTTGSYELLIERVGNGSMSGCAMRYGDTVFNVISNMEPELFYSFRASQGDIINVRMEQRSGDLDPYLRIVDSANYVIAFNDDVPGSGTDAAILGLLIPTDGTYYIAASRYGLAAGTSSGNFLLTLEESSDSGLGNSPVAALFIRMDGTLEGAITGEQFNRYYRFEARQNDLISIRMERIGGNLDSFLVLTNASLQELASDDDSGGGQDALIENFLIPVDGTYYVVATRYDRDQGTTTGRYRLSLEYEGNAFGTIGADVRRISYKPGMSITGSIDDVTPQVDYVFWGTEGETLTVSMNRGDGNLVPEVFILDDDRERVLTRVGTGAENVRIERFTIPETGIYYVRATRLSTGDAARSRGSFTLALAQIFSE